MSNKQRKRVDVLRIPLKVSSIFSIVDFFLLLKYSFEVTLTATFKNLKKKIKVMTTKQSTFNVMCLLVSRYVNGKRAVVLDAIAVSVPLKSLHLSKTI